MADSQGDVAQLSAEQQDALQQYLQVTNQDVAEAIPLLQRSQWNVQIAIAKFFDGEGPDLLAEAVAAENIPRTSARHENLQESLLAGSMRSSQETHRDRTDPAPRIVPPQPVTHRSPWILSLLFAPFGWGWRAASTLLRTVLYALSFLPAPLRPRAVTNGLGSSTRNTSGRRMLMPRDTAARFKREFDEDYGPNELPFFEGGLAQAHDLAKKDLKFLLVVLLSPEHDDTASFARDTLLAPEVVSFFNDSANRVVLWGGNVLDSEAYQIAAEYSCTKYPFTAVVCLTPKEGSTRMGIVKRLVGPMPAPTYLSEIQGVMERYGPDLDEVRAERAAQEVSRNLRTEQDSAYERSLAIDRERAREKKEAAAAAAEAEKRARQEAEAEEELEENRRLWKLWRVDQLRPEPAAGDKNVVRLALKLPEELGAGRIVRRFAQDASLEELYAFVECYDTISDEGREKTTAAERPGNYEHKFRFRIASTLPRVVYEPSTTATLGEKIGKSGNLMVEEISADSDDEEDERDE